jgi:hypothetical protein
MATYLAFFLSIVLLSRTVLLRLLASPFINVLSFTLLFNVYGMILNQCVTAVPTRRHQLAREFADFVI